MKITTVVSSLARNRTRQNITTMKLESRTRSSHPLLPPPRVYSTWVFDPLPSRRMFTLLGAVSRYQQPSPANTGSQPWRVPRWVMNSRPGVTLFTLTRIVGSARTAPARGRVTWLFHRDFDTSPDSRVAARIPWRLSLSLFFFVFISLRARKISPNKLTVRELSVEVKVNWNTKFSCGRREAWKSFEIH